jgi:hypothetical protein
VVVILLTEPPKRFVNHSAPSGPAVIETGRLTVEFVKLETTPDVVIRPIDTHRLSMARERDLIPRLMNCAPSFFDGAAILNPRFEFVAPKVTRFEETFVNHSAPSGPEVIVVGPLMVFRRSGQRCDWTSVNAASD